MNTKAKKVNAKKYQEDIICVLI